MASLGDAGPPDAVYARRNWIPSHRTEWARRNFEIAVEHGWVEGLTIYDTKDKARQKARYLMDKIVQLDLAQRWQLVGHVAKRQGGWIWSVEYTGERNK